MIMSLTVYLYDPTATYETHYLYESNITHNLVKMANKATVYSAIWRPDEIGFKTAEDIISILKYGLELLKEKPDYYKRFNPANGWGNYETLVSFVENYITACEKYPKAIIEVSR